jgi:hypothetical protein
VTDVTLSHSRVVNDTETTGLSLEHDVWEVALAVGEGPVNTFQLPHSLRNADPKALELNGYFSRFVGWERVSRLADYDIPRWLEGKTLIGANPAFDAYRLERRWGRAPWHYRLIDVESMAVSVLDLGRPLGLKGLVEYLTVQGWEIPENDHTAAGDVATTREIYRAIRTIGRRLSDRSGVFRG